MADRNTTILLVENEPALKAYLELALKSLGRRIDFAHDGEEAMERLASAPGEIAAVLLDLSMPDRDGLEILREVRQLYPDLPVIMLAEAPSPRSIVMAMKCGATDFLSMPVSHDDLRKAITRCLDVKPVEVMRPLKPVVAPGRAWMGNSPRMMDIQSIIGQVGRSEAPVLIQGETGSGKEMIARELHANSPRAAKALLKLNCAALPSELVESELFGYERGAFTGAFQRKAGMFEMADGGTILLDEIGDMDVRLQAKLLQVLQDHEFQRIGGKETIKVDVRVIAATHRDLETAIEEGKFREDLYYRLNVINLVVPPLRERKEDICTLAEILLQKHARPGAPVPAITPDLKAAMLSWDWPGNVRELENFARKLLIFQNPAEAARELRQRPARGVGKSASAGARVETAKPAALPALEQVTKAKRDAEAEVILNALNVTRWNRKQASVLLQIDYKALLYKMKKLGVEDRSAGDEPIPEPAPAVMKAGAL